MTAPSIAAQVLALQQMTLTELRLKWQQLTGEPTTQRNKAYLVKRCAWELQRQHFGGELSPAARQRLDELQAEFRTSPPSQWFRGARHNRAPAPPHASARQPVRSPREPVLGTIFTRQYKGRQIVVAVRGVREFEYEGQIFRSLSAVAKAVTGSHLSGHAFFGLTQGREERS